MITAFGFDIYRLLRFSNLIPEILQECLRTEKRGRLIDRMEKVIRALRIPDPKEIISIRYIHQAAPFLNTAAELRMERVL
jgi:hypothetical protein